MATRSPYGIGEIFPPSDGFKKFILYREPYEYKDIWLILPETDESFRVTLEFLRKWMAPLYEGDTTFIETVLDHFWNFYHCEFEPGVYRVTTLPLSDAYSYNLGGDGLDMVTKLANRIKSALSWNY
jgi:hypothetical protein